MPFELIRAFTRDLATGDGATIETNRLFELEGIGAAVTVNITIFPPWGERHVPRILVDELDWTRSARSILQVPGRRPGCCQRLARRNTTSSFSSSGGGGFTSGATIIS